MHRTFTVVLLTAAIAIAVAVPVAAQKTAANSTNNSGTNITMPPSPSSALTVNSYDVSARNIVRLYASCLSGNLCELPMNSELAAPYVVPQGKRLVITGYSATMTVTTGSTNFAFVTEVTSVIFLDLHKLYSDQILGTDSYVANGTGLNWYVDQGSNIYFTASTNTNFVAGGVSISAWGYLVDCGTSGCTKE